MQKGIPNDLRAKVGDLRQFASVRRITFDDGPERGVRAIAFSTGGGLDFWILSDRSMDIGPLWHRGKQLGWQTPGGFVAPTLLNSDSENGQGFSRGFSGFLVTCGMVNIRQPRDGQPLHGRLPFTPARVTAYGEDWNADEPVLFAEGEILEATHGGECLRLRRRIEAPIGGRSLRIRDVVENDGNVTVPHEMLYHFNLSWPMVEENLRISLDGEDLPCGPESIPEPKVGPARSWPCKSPTADVRIVGGPESGTNLIMKFETDTLGHLQLWRDMRRNVGVLSVEPVTSSQSSKGDTEKYGKLPAAEKRSYSIDLEFMD